MFRFLKELFRLPEGDGIGHGSYEIAFFLKYLRPVMKLGILCVVAGILISAIKVLFPLSTKILIDYIFLGKDPSDVIEKLYAFLPPWIASDLSWIFYSLAALVAAVIILGILTIVLELFRSYVTIRFRESYTFNLQSDLFRHVLRFPISYFRSQQTGYVMSRLTDDVRVLDYIFSQFIPQMLSSLIYILMSVGILFALNGFLTLLIILLAPLFLAGNYFFARYISAVTYEEREKRADISKNLQEIVAGIDSVKIHTSEDREHTRFKTTLLAAIETRIRNTMLNSLSQQVRFGTQSLIMVVVLWVGGCSVLSGGMTVGDFVAYTAYIATFSGALNSLLSFPVLLQPAFISAERIQEIFSLPPECDDRNEGTIPGRIDGTIAFSDVSFSYRERVPILSNISFKIEKGTIFGLSGKTGAGKTTIANLILRFYRPDRGRILLDGRDIATLNCSWLREQISVVAQDIVLFNTTIRENILYSKPGATREEVAAAAKKALIHDEIMAFPEKYETIVGERGTLLSAGQRQRISIARAFLKNAPILILDEPTSALDAQNEKNLLPILLDLSSDRTTILISHRTPVLAIADMAYNIDEGTARKNK